MVFFIVVSVVVSSSLKSCQQARSRMAIVYSGGALARRAAG
jgi:hypothetical protein